ncbi:hypothetical protein HY492_03490 [Candidatus Woesearchaeota archaeon]|nr:hypothetical protein [Candidatus Woesearchaeota archaeon]
MNLKPIIPIIALSALAAFVPAMLTGDPLAAIKFSLAFTGLFVLPLAPWVALLDKQPLEQTVIAIMLGIPAAAITFFIIGVLKGPLTLPIFVGIPALIFAVGCWRLSKRQA